MSTLAVDTLREDITLVQKINLTESITLVGVKVNLLRLGQLTDGELVLDVVREDDVIATKTILYSELNDLRNSSNIAGTYWHGMVTFQFDSPVVIKLDSEVLLNEVQIQLTISEHTNSDSLFTAWIKDSDPSSLTYLDGEFPEFGEEPTEDVWYKPFGLELHTL